MASALAKLQGLGQKMRGKEHYECRTLNVNIAPAANVDIEFRNISMNVSMGIIGNKKKTILDNVSGIFKSGHLTAIMGPSGAGKSSLLNALTGFCLNGVEGTIRAGEAVCKIGKDVSSNALRAYRKKSCYILQDDRLDPLFTVKELMTFAADCKLGNMITPKLKNSLISDILETLGLKGHENTRAGNLSGGQRKRLSIAVELIDNPPVVFLDEPTTGLDSLTTNQCISMLKNLAKGGRTIVCTIHQPTALIYKMFDQVYILAEGMCIYDGTSESTVPYLSSMGFNCPVYHNPADYILEIANGEYGNFNELMAARCIRDQKIEKVPPHLEEETPSQLSYGKMSIIVNQPHEAYRFGVLFKRCLRQQYRDWTVTHLKVILHLFLGIILGLVFDNAGNDGSKTFSNLGFLLISTTYLCYTSVMPAVLRFPDALPVLKKENFNNWYGLKTYYAATLVTTIPIQIWYSFVYSLPAYTITGQPLELSRFVMFVLILAHVTLLADAIGNVIGSCLNPINGTFFGAIITCIMLGFAGFLVLLPHMHPIMQFISYGSFLRHAFEGLVLSVYSYGRTPIYCPDSVGYCHMRYKIIIVSLVIILNLNICHASYYQILGVSKQASAAEIRQAFKKLAIKLHPDKNSNEDVQESFFKITEAYETLKDPEKRHQYDMYGSHQAYIRKHDFQSQSKYNDIFIKGLYHKDPNVETITPSTYKTFLNSGLHFINFYSPFCPPCQNLADDWKKLAELYKGIIKFGAVNCKYYNSFCYHSMRIGNYPSLYLYPNGKEGSFVQYTGQRTFEDLEKFVLLYIKKRVKIPVVKDIGESDKPIAYVLDTMNENMLLRIAYRLYWVTNMVKIDDDLRRTLQRDLETKILLKYNNRTVWIKSTDEQTIIKKIVGILPTIEQVGLKKIQDIRNALRNEKKMPWVLYFSTQGDDKLLVHHLKVNMPNMMFGEINCDKLGELCHSLQVNKAPAWGILKSGGGYQRLFGEPTQSVLEKAAKAYNMHTLSASDFKKILEDDSTTWVLLIAPHQSSWQHMIEPFIEASLEFIEVGISFGVMSCSKHTNDYCRSVSENNALIAVQERGKLHKYRGEIDKSDIVEFVDLIKDIDDFSLSEQQVLEISDVSSRDYTWVVAFLPLHCGHVCDELLHEMRIVSKRLRPLKFVRVGALWCKNERTSGFCNNVRAPTLRVYPLASGRHFTIPLQQLSKAPYILEWALNHIDDSIVNLNTHTFYSQTQKGSEKPWVVYFHSPRCYKCYEMYTDFAIVAHHLNNVINFGKVNCISERQICQQEYINSYPSMHIYLNENERQPYRAVVNLQVTTYSQLWNDLQPHLRDYNDDILAKFNSFDITSQYLRDEL
ncbi:dnaJ homolog subfamily C member 10 [Pieris rapae]|uniref:dnaJ homolog subfamily C member 10 n=1 Tax=Pieris rapae TaxID=64459 RepID=UPI001E281469|nr:dnaJ homolog subfamily C member 10 [Pieris rapae]